MASNSKRIGFVDLDVANFHADTYLAAVRGKLVNRGFSVMGCAARNIENGTKWASQNGVMFFNSVEGLAAHVDYFMILAPSHPEVHLPLCREVFPFGKPTYVDKTFATSLDEAKQIFALADQCGIPIQTTSALRYTNVQEFTRECAEAVVGASAGGDIVRHLVTFGGGRSFDEYGIHPVEMAISCMGHQAKSLMRRGDSTHWQLLVNFADERTAVINSYLQADTPYAAVVTTCATTRLIAVDKSQMFLNTASAVLDFFESRTPNVDRRQSLMVRAILDAAKDPRAKTQFVPLAN